MEIRNNNGTHQSKPVFQARTSKALLEELMPYAETTKRKALFNNQIRILENIGDKSSEIGTSFNLSEGVRSLSLFNKKLSSSYSGTLPMKKNQIYDSFMALNEQDIIKAENEIKDAVSTNKTALILKAAKDKETMIKIAGKANPTDEEFAAAIDKLSEEEITRLRLGLQENPIKNGSMIDFQI